MPTTETKFYTVPAGSRPSQCNGKTCHAMIYWIRNPKTGRMMPIDCDVEGGEVPTEKAPDRNQLDAFTRTVSEHDGRGVSHFTTCVDAAQFSHTGQR